MSISQHFQEFQSAIARIFHTNGTVVGAGFLVSNQQLFTCAHVITAALSISTTTTTAPTDLIDIDFPLVEPGKKLKAKVVFWRPAQLVSAISLEKGEDIAGLQLESVSSTNCQPMCLITTDDLWEHPFRVFGFPSQREMGIWASGVLRSRLANGWVQMEDLKITGYPVKPGFSGSPVWDEKLGGVVGMTVASEKILEQAKAAFMIPAYILARASLESSLQITTDNLLKKQVELLNREANTTNPLIFISYALEDERQARDLYNRLKREGFNPWIDKEDVLPGEDWDFKVRQTLKQADFLIVCLSNSSVSKRGYIQKHIKMALDLVQEMPEGAIFLIPARLEDCKLPESLAKYQYVDLFESNGFNKIVSSLFVELTRREHG